MRLQSSCIPCNSPTKHNMETKFSSVGFSAKVMKGFRNSWLQTLGNQLLDRSWYIRYVVLEGITYCRMLLEYSQWWETALQTSISSEKPPSFLIYASGKCLWAFVTTCVFSWGHGAQPSGQYVVSSGPGRFEILVGGWNTG